MPSVILSNCIFESFFEKIKKKQRKKCDFSIEKDSTLTWKLKLFQKVSVPMKENKFQTWVLGFLKKWGFPGVDPVVMRRFEFSDNSEKSE